jgi:hypothetical protein
MRIIIPLIVVLVSTINPILAQFTIGTFDKNLQISGYITSFYNKRFYDVTEVDRDKDRFNLDFAVLRIQGSDEKRIRYELQVNLPAIYSTDPTDEFLMQATAEYRSMRNDFAFQFGYDKLPFSWSSLLPQNQSAFMQRAESIRGKTFNRRDMGITLTKGFLNKRVVLTGGVYTGEGIQSITGDNDPNGKFLYAGRIEASYPAHYRNEEIDVNHTAIPRVKIGADMSYTEKTRTTGTDYPILTVNGKKKSYSGDVTASWKGFSAHAEIITFRIQPNDTLALLGKPTDYYLAQGVILQMGYFSTVLNSVFAVRYDEFNPNDLVVGDNRQTVSLAYNYLIDGMNNLVKLHYFYRLTAEKALEPWSENQLRIGWQIMF